MNIYVANLSWNTNSDSLQELFSQYGEVTSAYIINDRETGRSRGFGFVEMPNDEEGQKAIDALNETEFEGKNIAISAKGTGVTLPIPPVLRPLSPSPIRL